MLSTVSHSRALPVKTPNAALMAAAVKELQLPVRILHLPMAFNDQWTHASIQRCAAGSLDPLVPLLGSAAGHSSRRGHHTMSELMGSNALHTAGTYMSIKCTTNMMFNSHLQAMTSYKKPTNVLSVTYISRECFVAVSLRSASNSSHCQNTSFKH